MTLRLQNLATFGAIWIMGTTPLVCQEPTVAPASATIRLFIDAQSVIVDSAFLKTEISWVEWMRDQKDADVDLLVSSKLSGGGGTTYYLRFLGQGEFQGVEDSLTYSAPGVATPDEIRHGLANVISLGLMRYLARKPGADQVGISIRRPPAGGGLPPIVDPWNAWVYQVGVNGFFNGEAADSSSTTSANLSANRVTGDDLFRFNANGSWNKSRYEIGPGQTLYTHTGAFTSNLVEANGVNQHWTWGVLGSFTRSSVQNLQSSFRVAPAIEYSLWNYADSNQRGLTLLYQVGAGRNQYMQETILGKTAENVYDNALAITLNLNQPWGSVTTSLSGSAYLHDWSQYSVGLTSTVMVRLGRGFSLNFAGGYTKQQNQISLPLANATPSQVLLHLTQLPSSYTYFGTFGFSYTFGSIFNGVVNSRFVSAGGGATTTVIVSQ